MHEVQEDTDHRLVFKMWDEEKTWDIPGQISHYSDQSKGWRTGFESRQIFFTSTLIQAVLVFIRILSNGQCQDYK
jgi:hypothetical protein